jgi:hypothetical protein
MEIGSEFWLDNIPNESNSQLPKWLSKFGDVVLTSSGRGAITLLLHQLKPRFKTVLMPSYICDSVILPFIEQGYRCYLYEINEDLSPNIESINSYNEIGVFVHMGYYGFPTNSNLTEVITHLKSQSTVIVEDITHTLFSTYKRFEGNDYYVASIRKWFGLPSGGLLASTGNSKSIKSNFSYNESFYNLRKAALLSKSKYVKNGDETLKSLYLDLFAKAETLLDEDVTPYGIDNLSKDLIVGLDLSGLIKTRKSNYRILVENLKDVNYVDSIFTDIPEEVCPMFYPVFIKNNRNEIRKKLIEEKVYCPVHWPIPDRIEINKFKKSLEVYNTILSIPCDQRYMRCDMERLVSVLKGL